jgi:uncharacterized membrane protein YgcG
MTAIRRFAIGFLALLIAAAPAAAVERILLFVSDVSVQHNGDLLVTETIRVQAEGRNIRRGILRDFPTTYTRNDGTRVVVGFHVESVTRDGAAEHYVVETIVNGARIRIGQSDRILRTGPHEYVIRYRTTRQIGFFADYDELYWNATGNGWTFAIDQAEARITLPEKVPFRQTAIYTGPQGARGKDAAIVEQQPGRIVFRTTRPLPARNGLTVAASWQRGLIEPPSTGRLAGYWIEDNRALVVAAAGVLILLLYYATAWFAVGRDPPSGTIIPLFGPPAGMSPAAARYVDHMGFDDRCFTAAIIGLGVAGHLRIVESGSDSVLEKRDGGRAIAPEEQVLMSRLFAGNKSLVLDQVNHLPLGRAKTALNETLDRNYSGKLFAGNFVWSSIGLVLFIAVVLGTMIAAGTSGRAEMIATLVMIALMSLPFAMLGAGMMFTGLQRSRGGRGLLYGGLALFVIAVAVALFIMWYNVPGEANLFMAVMLCIASAIAGIAFPMLKAPSKSGRKVMDDIEGFRQYLGVAEEDRLNALNPPEKTPELFERFLPYAVALDVQNAWAARFAGVLAAAGATAAATSWYVGHREWWNDPVSFADHIGSSLSQTISSASTAPGSSSGSGGGGSSGGGGGGGGGSGW